MDESPKADTSTTSGSTPTIGVDREDEAALLYNDAQQLYKTYDTHGDIEKLDRAIGLYRRLKDDYASVVSEEWDLLAHLATALLARWLVLDDVDAREEALGLAREQLEREGASTRPFPLITLANVLRARYVATEEAAALEEALARADAALISCDNRSSLYPDILGARWRIVNDSANKLLLGTSVPALEDACTNTPDPVKRATLLHSLAAYYRDLYHSNSSGLEDLERASRLYHLAITLLPESNHRVPVYRINLAMINFTLVSLRGNLDEVNILIEDLKTTLGLLRTGSASVRSVCLRLLSRAHLKRFEFSGKIRDLDSAIQSGYESLAEAPTSFHIVTQTLSSVLIRRYNVTGNLEDLEEALSYSVGAVSACWSIVYGRLVNRVIALNNLAYNLMDLLPLGVVCDLHLIIAMLRHALSLCQADDDGVDIGTRILVSGNLAMSLELASNMDIGISALTEAIDLRNEILETSPHGPNILGVSLSHAGRAYYLRYRQLRNPDDALQSKLLLSRALRILCKDHPHRSECMFRFVLASSECSEGGLDPSRVSQLLSSAIEDGNCSTRSRIKNAADALPLLARKYSHCVDMVPVILHAYILAIRLLPRTAFWGLSIQHRLQAIAVAKTLTSDAAALAVTAANYLHSLELLEQGRAIFWSQALRLRTTFDSLPTAHKKRLGNLARQLEMDSFDMSTISGDERQKMALEARAIKRRTNSEELDDLIEEVRNIPGFEHFMLPEEAGELMRVAAHGPVVVLVSSSLCCCAIIIASPGDLRTVLLSDVSIQWLETSAAQWRGCTHRSREINRKRRSRNEDSNVTDDLLLMDGLIEEELTVLGAIWNAISKPIIEALELKTATGTERRRVWWCPTGDFAFLPIHAAGVYPHGPSCSDYFVSSYTPTIGALLRAREGMVPLALRDTKMLLAAVPKPFSLDYWDELPGTMIEMERVARVLPKEVLLDLPPDQNPLQPSLFTGTTSVTVLERLTEVSMLHLACHGNQEPKNPLESGFILSDKELTIATIMPLSLPRAFFAFLSACETAKGDSDQPDQALHLAAAMLFVGFKSIVGTMWSMGDEDGPVVAETIYSQLFEGSPEYLDHNTIPYALDAAIQKIRAEDPNPSRWAQYIHLGI